MVSSAPLWWKPAQRAGLALSRAIRPAWALSKTQASARSTGCPHFRRTCAGSAQPAAAAPKPMSIVLEPKLHRHRPDTAEVSSSGVAGKSFEQVQGSHAVVMACSNASAQTDAAIAEVGLMYSLLAKVKSIGYFRAVASSHEDRRVGLMRKVFGIKDRPERMYGMTYAQAKKLLVQGKEEQVLETIRTKYQACIRAHDFVIVSGVNQRMIPSYAKDLNVKIADTLQLPMVWCTDVAQFLDPNVSPADAILHEIAGTAPKGISKVPIAGVIATNIHQRRLQNLRESNNTWLSDKLEEADLKVVAVLPSHRTLRMRTMREIASCLGAEVLAGKDSLDEKHVGRLFVSTIQVRDLIRELAKVDCCMSESPQSGFSEQQKKEFHLDFKKFEMEPGKMRLDELGLLLNEICVPCSKEAFEAVLEELRMQGSLHVSFEQFLSVVSRVWDDGEPRRYPLIVTNAARIDILLSLMLASRSESFPPVAGILLTDTDTFPLPPEVSQMLQDAPARGVPVISIPQDTLSATEKIHNLHGLLPRLLATATAKLQVAADMFAQNVSPAFIDAIVEGKSSREDLSSRIFLHNIASQARNDLQHIVLPEGEDWRVLAAASELLARGLCTLTILGDEKSVRQLSRRHNLTLDGANIVDPRKASDLEHMVSELTRLRAGKGMTPEVARSWLMTDYTWYGTMMIHLGLADGMVSGAAHTTADTMRPAMQVIKTEAGKKIVSSLFFMLLPDKVMAFSDCAINVDPSPEELAEIALCTAETAAAFGVAPRVAMLSYATGTSNSGPEVDKVRIATAIAKKRNPQLLIEGPTQFDAAVDPDVAKIKFQGSTSQVAGRASVCVFPDLNTGNNTYKAVQQASKCIAIGPISQGLRRPVNDLSRGCTVSDILNTVLITCIQAISSKKLKPSPHAI